MIEQYVNSASKKFFDAVHVYIKEQSLVKPNDTIIVGLSGGPDSVCLLAILKQLAPLYNIRLIAAHLDHEWRKESAQDALFCQNLAHTYGIEFRHMKASQINLPKKYTGSKEELGRALRRAFFELLVQEYGAQSIALGHHQDDQQETFFLRLIRGSSLSGLASIRAKNGCYIRPLLESYKNDILSFLQSQGLSFVIDVTNEQDHFLRNALRLKALPALKNCDKRFDNSFKNTLNYLQQADDFLERLTLETYKKIAIENSSTKSIHLERFKELDPFLQHRVLLTWLCDVHVAFTPTKDFFQEIIRFLNNKAQEHRVHKDWSLKKDSVSVCIKVNN